MNSLKTVVFAAIAAIAGASPAAAQVEIETPKAAFILYGKISDGGWTLAQEKARRDLADQFDMDIPYVENVASTNEAVANVLDLYISRGYNVLIGGTYGFSDGFLAAAEAHPDLAFVNISGVTKAPNLESFYARTYEGWYLAGMAAASASSSDRIGIVAAFPLPYVVWDVNAFALGAQSVKPGIETVVTFTNSWSDPVKETQLAKSLIENGVDVLATAMDSTAVPVVAEAAGLHSIGYKSDMSSAAPEGMLTSVVYNWSGALIPIFEEIKAGSWESKGSPLYGMQEGVIEVLELRAGVPADAAEKIAEARAQIEAGTLSPFEGPIYAQDGSLKVAEGAQMSVEALWGSDFLVQGVQGNLK
ncbi:BMP family ABC transporter substrate-binding protein [Antarctobacter sp.]|uniref:BMP family ABC transporter substrate-binding protein n=1 Tax=Antarctobacter sp. TaxID=1872577 RepID=UPI002B268698|nr:BMP family ABC transporter substrate-binding protein [Antarctobacter sp.]